MFGRQRQDALKAARNAKNGAAADGAAHGATPPPPAAAAAPSPAAAPETLPAPTPAPAAAKTGPSAMSAALGEIAWVLARSRLRKRLPFDALNWMVAPALAAGQARVFRQDGRPIGFALWARLSEAAEARLTAEVEAGRPARLLPEEWTSGDRLWLMELVTVLDARVRQAALLAALTAAGGPLAGGAKMWVRQGSAAVVREVGG